MGDVTLLHLFDVSLSFFTWKKKSHLQNSAVVLKKQTRKQIVHHPYPYLATVASVFVCLSPVTAAILSKNRKEIIYKTIFFFY